MRTVLNEEVRKEMMRVFYKKEVSLIRRIQSACAKDLRQDSVCILREQGSRGGGLTEYIREEQ